MKEAKKLLQRKTTNGRKSSALTRMAMIFDKRDSLGSSVIEMGVPTELNTLGDEDDSEKQHGMTNEVEALRDVFY